MKILNFGLVLLSFVSLVPEASAKKAQTYLEVQSMKCTGQSDSSHYSVVFDRRLNAKQIAFEAVSKSNAADVKKQELSVATWTYYPEAKGPHFAVKAKDGENHWAEFAVDTDGVAREKGNDIWWYTEAIPSSLIQFKCKFDEALRDKEES